ncbi:CocE/NonD family hydrolase, partial [Phenylobacterium sp.]|uniref:CocE/NonD family hydrolase n=1 Tax=Phenylobacterium sp. TaxID=1871053 RepID=UPI002F3FDC45
PKKALFGPWGHIYPDLGQPGPGLDWATEEVAWWRHWLGQETSSVMAGPLFRFFVGYATPAETAMREVPGRWASETDWPSPAICNLSLHLAPGRLAPVPATGRVRYRAERVVGLTAPEWIPYAAAELPRDQRPDDARSLTFDVAVTEPMEVVGAPLLRLRVSSDKPLASVAARLCEVAADGRSWLVTSGVLNLCFRDGFEATPKRLTPGESYDIDLALDPIAHRFKPGSTLRLALSEGLWPLVWPAPETPTLEFDLQGCRLGLPVRPIPDTEAAMPIPLIHSDFSRGDPRLEIREEPGGAVRVQGAWPDGPQTVAATSTTLSGAGPDMELHYDPRDPNSCRWRVTQSSRYQRGDWDCETRVAIEMTSTPTHFLIEERLLALKSGAPIFDVTRRDEIRRRFS